MHWEASVYSQPGQTGVISIAADSQGSTRELRNAKSWKQQSPRRATSCQGWDGPDLISNQHSKHVQVEAL